MNRSQTTIRKRGSILLSVTIIIALVSLAAYGFTALMRVESKAANLRGNQLQAESIAESACELLASMVSQPRMLRDKMGQLHDAPHLFQSIAVDGLLSHQDNDRESSVVPRHINEDMTRVPRAGRFFVVAANDDPKSESKVRFGCTYESSKLDLTTLLEWDRDLPGSARNALLKLPRMNEFIADTLLDWSDEDSEKREFGAEEEDYAQRVPVVIPGNQVPISLDELQDIPGMHQDAFHGPDKNRNHRLDPHEVHMLPRDPQDMYRRQTEMFRDDNRSVDAGAAALIPIQQTSRNIDVVPRSWSAFLTVHNRHRNESYAGQRRIFVNDDRMSSLHENVFQRFGKSVADFVVAFRQFGPSRGEHEDLVIEYTVDVGVAASHELKSIVDLFVANVKVVSGTSDEMILANPFVTNSDEQKMRIVDFCDATTLVKGDVITGRNDINTALPEVLAGIPHMSQNIQDAILMERGEMGNVSSPSRSFEDWQQLTQRSHPIWLYLEGHLDIDTARKLLPYLTTGGDVIHAQIVACYDATSPWMRCKTIVDGTERFGRSVYYKDLRLLGRGFH